MTKLSSYLVALITFPLIWVPGPVFAQDLAIVPSIGVRGEYDDNVAFSRIAELSDYSLSVSPGLRINYSTELLDLETIIDADIQRFRDLKVYDTERYFGAVNAGYQLAEKWKVTGHFSYIRDTTLDSQLEETGLVSVRSNRDRYNGNAGVAYQIDEISDVGLSYAYAKTEFEFPGDVDYDSDTITLSYNRRISERLGVFTVQPFWDGLNSEVSKIDNFGLSFGWSPPITETWQLIVFLGTRYTTVDFKEFDFSTSSWSGVGDISFRRTTEASSLSVGYRQDLHYDTRGDPIQVYRLYGSYDRRLIARLRIGLYGTFYLTQSEVEPNVRDARFFEVRPYLRYQITEDHSLDLSYSYQWEDDRAVLEDSVRDRNRIWLSLDFRWPRKL